MGAKHDAVDAFGDNAVHRSALNFHTPVLEYFIKRMEKNETKSLPVWDLLVGESKTNPIFLCTELSLSLGLASHSISLFLLVECGLIPFVKICHT